MKLWSAAATSGDEYKLCYLDNYKFEKKKFKDTKEFPQNNFY